MSNNTFDDFDEQSQKELQGYNFLSFEDMKRGIIGRDPFEGIRSNKILVGETIRGMTNVHPLVTQKFHNRTTKEISRLYFPDAEKTLLKGQDAQLNIDVDCEDANKYLVATTDFYFDYNKNNKLDKGEFAFKLYVFSSKNGPKLKEAFECVIPQKGEMLVFIEDNTDDWSKQIVRIKIAEDVKNAIKNSHLHHSKVLDFINRKTEGEGLSAEGLKQLLETGQVIEKLTITSAVFIGIGYLFSVVFSPFKAIGWVLEKIGQAANHLKLTEKVWDTQNEEYLFNKENILSLLTIDTSFLVILEQDLVNDKSKLEWNDLIPDFATQKIIDTINYLKAYIKKYNAFIEKKVTSWFENPEELFKFQGKVALASGLYNGIIDFIGSTLQFIGSLAEAPFDVANNFQDFLEVIDNIWESITNIDWDVFWTALSGFYTTIKTKLKDENGEFDWVRIAYIIGFGVVFVGTIFIPIAGWVGKVAKLSKLIPEELLVAMQKGLSSIKQSGKNAKQSALRTIEHLFALFAKGKEIVIEFFGKLANIVAEWFLKNKKKFIKQLILVQDATEFIKKFTLTTSQHINYGHITITKINPKLPKTNPSRILDKYKYTPKRGKLGLKKYNYKVTVGGMHNLNYLNRYVKLVGKLELVGKLPTGEKVYKGVVSFWIKENKRWKVKDYVSTFFPKQWSKQKIAKVIEEASLNITDQIGNKYIGVTKNGTKIEMWVNQATKEINSAYIIF